MTRSSAAAAAAWVLDAADVAAGTGASVASLMSAPVNASGATLEPSTALALMAARVTALGLSSRAPTLRAGSFTAAYDAPPMASSSAMNATTSDGETRPAKRDFLTDSPFSE